MSAHDRRSKKRILVPKAPCHPADKRLVTQFNLNSLHVIEKFVDVSEIYHLSFWQTRVTMHSRV